MSKDLFSTLYPDLDLSIEVGGRPTAFAFYWLGALKSNIDVSPGRNLLYLTVASVDKWKTLSPENKKRFEELAEKKDDSYDMVVAAESWKVVSEMAAMAWEEHNHDATLQPNFLPFTLFKDGRPTAYLLFWKKCWNGFRHGKIQVTGDFNTWCDEKWKTMSDEEKKNYIELNNNIERYIMLRKTVRGPIPPRLPWHPLEFFVNAERYRVKAQGPAFFKYPYFFEYLTTRRWTSLDQETRSKYEAEADRDRVRFETDMTHYRTMRNEMEQITVVPDSNDAKEKDKELGQEQATTSHEKKLDEQQDINEIIESDYAEEEDQKLHEQ